MALVAFPSMVNATNSKGSKCIKQPDGGCWWTSVPAAPVKEFIVPKFGELGNRGGPKVGEYPANRSFLNNKSTKGQQSVNK